MTKFIVGIAIVAFCSFCGYKLAGKYRRKKEFYRQFSVFNQRFLEELGYHRRPIAEFARHYRYQGDFQILINCFLSSLNTKQDDNAFLEEGQFPFLKKEERMEIQDYFFMLGRGDTQAQKNYFSSVKNWLEARYA